jgi:phytoene desaturase
MEEKNTKRKSVAIIGSGFGGLATACLLGKKGYAVTVYEKNDQLGGRARVKEKNGFKFDMGPSWYMMPDVFEHFFDLLDEKIEDHYELIKLTPSYRIKIQNKEKIMDFKSGTSEKFDIFEEIEPTATLRLKEYLANAKRIYEIAKNEFMYRNYNSIFDFMNFRVFKEGRKFPIFKPVDKIISKYIFSEDLRHALEFQSVLLGTSPTQTPGIYTIMNHIDLDYGIFYPMGGMFKVRDAMINIAKKYNVKFITNCEIQKINIIADKATSIVDKNQNKYLADYIISGADSYFTEQKMLDIKHRIKTPEWWDKKIMTPSAFIIYLGIKGKIKELIHHNLLFSKSWEQTEKDVFELGGLPKDPSLYISMPSHTDDNVAPKDYENLFVLVPIKAGQELKNEDLDKYSEYVIEHIEKEFQIPDFKNRIELASIYSTKDFFKDYNAYKGNALAGMAHTLTQTAIGRPNNYHPKIKNLFFVGAGTNPGIGVPICLISAEMVYKRMHNIKSPEPLKKL